MGICSFRDGTVIQDYSRPYIVAEVNSSHNGDVEVARQMIDAAAECGADCVKFQSWSVDTLYSKSYYKENPIAKRFVKKFSLAPSDLAELAKYAKGTGIAFSSTPYSEEEVDFLIKMCDAPYVKIASMELNNPKFLRYIAKKDIPIVLSTGMGETAEIREAVSVLEDAGATQLVLLHCVSIYPVDIDTVNLNNIIGLREMFPNYPIGFSDHTVGDAAAVAAVALGAALIEKHLTLDRSKIGMDNGMATEPEAFQSLVQKCRDIQRGMGTKERTVTTAEYEQRKKMRRSLVATRDLKAGDVLAAEDICAKRPGGGIAPDKLEGILGKCLNRDISADMLIMPEDIT